MLVDSIMEHSAINKVFDNSVSAERHCQCHLPCLICMSLALQDSRESECDHDCNGNSSFHHSLSIRNISRYLQSFPLDVNVKKKLYDLTGKLEKDKFHVSWTICSKCSKMATEFDELFHHLEVTKLRLNWCLEKMQDVMTTVTTTTMTSTKAASDSFAKTFKEDEDCCRSSVRKLLRDALEDHLEGSSATFPRVVLYKTPVPPGSSHVYDNESDDMAINAESSGWEIEDDSDITEQPTTASSQEIDIDIKVKMECSENSEKVNVGVPVSENVKRKRIKILVRKKDRVPTITLKCSLCRAQYPESYSGLKTGPWKLHLHVIQYHCDQLFLSHKMDSVTDSQFKIIVGDILFQDLIKETEDTTCVYCHKRFKKLKESYRKKVIRVASIKAHLIQDHYQELEEILKTIQGDPDLSKLLADRDSYGQICKCGVYLQNQASQVAHNKWHCLLATKNELQTPPKFPRTRSDFISNFVCTSKSSSLKPEWMCKHCNKFFKFRNTALRHWKYTCEKGKRLSAPRDGTLSCDYCSYKISNSLQHKGKLYLKLHLLQHHPEHFFLSELEEKSLSQWKRDHFKDILRQVLYPKFAVKEGQSEGIPLSCSLCGRKYLGKQSRDNLKLFKKHLVSNHKTELKKSLQVILEDSDASLRSMLTK